VAKENDPIFGSRMAGLLGLPTLHHHQMTPYGLRLASGGEAFGGAEISWAGSIGDAPQPSQDWLAHFHDAMEQISSGVAVRVESLHAVLRLERRIAELEGIVAKVSSGSPVVVPIPTLAPKPLRLKKDIPILLQSNGEEYVASFLDANINASGETQAEAVDNLKDILAAVFEKLRSLSPAALGTGPTRQLAVLTEFIESK
jgi:predicted RNase H-like HicB family nuclease